jgi:hypothetical protein
MRCCWSVSAASLAGIGTDLKASENSTGVVDLPFAFMLSSGSAHQHATPPSHDEPDPLTSDSLPENL